MEIEKGDLKKTNFILKKLERYLSSIDKPTKSSSKTKRNIFTKSRSWHIQTKRATEKTTPNGCFSVYVGPEKQRFVIKTEFANHPLFRMLLEDAELEYGFENGGPLLLPCDVDLFYKVLAEMDDGDQFERGTRGLGYGCGSPFSPARRLGKRNMAKGCGSYGLLTPPRSLAQY
ncbi:auxin-induced protein x10a [Phtheirospermum japonicum]|uniref:Auxin-induced protein x10a n=1 Tax=Phtheirospermum japonicum TaxID=374723 RepID=A0A830CBI9_9LAMI|nr:auxin-induced protein x10a [Phtheirospermum japonicum]